MLYQYILVPYSIMKWCCCCWVLHRSWYTICSSFINIIINFLLSPTPQKKIQSKKQKCFNFIEMSLRYSRYPRTVSFFFQSNKNFYKVWALTAECMHCNIKRMSVPKWHESTYLDKKINSWLNLDINKQEEYICILKISDFREGYLTNLMLVLAHALCLSWSSISHFQNLKDWLFFF